MNLNPAQVRSQIERLKAVAPEAWDEGEEQLLRDMLEGETTFNEFLTVVESQRADAATMAGALASRIAEMQIRQERFVRKEKAMRSLALSIMQAAGVGKVLLATATLSVAKGRQSLSVNEDAVPEDFLKYTPSPDKAAIKAALERGETFNWARMSTGEPTLTIRTK